MSDQSTHLQNLRLLVVDDDGDTRDILTLLFELEGAEIRCAACGQEAIEIISDFEPDILISDVSIDDEDGCWLLPKIRNSEVLKHKWIPAIAITGWSSEKDKEYTSNAGFQKHLCKPLNLDELVDVVASLANCNQDVMNQDVMLKTA